MKQSGRPFIPLFTLIKLLQRHAAFTCLSLLSPWRSLHPLSPRQHKLRDLESGVGWQEEERFGDRKEWTNNLTRESEGVRSENAEELLFCEPQRSSPVFLSDSPSITTALSKPHMHTRCGDFQAL